MKQWMGLFLSILLYSASVCGADTACVQAVKIAQPPRLDGKLDEPFWNQAKSCGDFYLFGKEGKRAEDTEFKVAYDSTWLYFGIKCVNKGIKRLEAKYKSHNDPVTRDESVEIFLDPGSKGKLYFHFMLSYNNVRAEKMMRGGTRDNKGSIPWLSATAVGNDGWSAEIAIPLYMLLSYGNADGLRLNVAHNQRCPQLDAQGVVISDKLVSGTWRPVARDFHAPNTFGAVSALSPGKIQVPLLASLEEVKIKPYQERGSQAAYAVAVMVRGANFKTGELEVVVTDVPVAGEKTAVARRFTQKGSMLSDLNIMVPVAAPCERSVEVVLRNPATGELFAQQVIGNPECLNVMETYLDRNYYTDEKEATAVAEIKLPVNSLKDMEIAVNCGGRVLGRAAAGTETRVFFPVAALPVGEHQAAVELRRKGGNLFFSQNVTLVKRVPKPGCEWKIDKINRVVLNNGKPFFHLSLTMYYGHYKDESGFKLLADNGFNTYMHWTADTNPAAGAEYLKVAQKYGLFVEYFSDAPCLSPIKTPGFMESPRMKDFLNSMTPSQHKFAMDGYYLKYGITALKILLCGFFPNGQLEGVFSEYYQRNLNAMLAGVNAVKDYSNLTGYVPFEEIASFQYKSMLDFYRQVNNADGYHPIVMLFSGEPPQGVEKMAFYDILAQDPYWIPSSGGYRSTPRYVGGEVSKLIRRGAARRAPVWITVANETFSGDRPYTTRELEAETWLAIINGATGINYFNDGMILASTITTHKRLNALLNKIMPALTAPQVKQEITYRNGRVAAGGTVKYTVGEFNPEKNIFPDIQAVLKKAPDGQYVLLAANCFDRPAKATFALAGLNGSAECLFTGRKIAVTDGTFSEDLGGYGVRAYKLQIANPRQPVKITVSSAVKESDIKPEYVSPENGCRQGSRNVLLNPSFEKASRPGYPDNYNFYCKGTPGHMIGDKKQAIGQVGSDAYHGKYSLLLSKIPESPGSNAVYFGCYPQEDKETPYTFSFYAKTDTPGLKLLFRGGYGKETFTLTKEWKRYSVILKVPPKANKSREGVMSFMVQTFGRVWLDAMQFERGEQVTEFKE